MSYVIPKNLAGYLAPSDAAALAVICAHVRNEQDEARFKAVAEPLLEERKESEEEIEVREVYAFLQELESIACHSIAMNDGKVVYWVGQAAKQMNPILS